MKNNIIWLIIFILFQQSSVIGKELSILISNTGDTCQFGPKIWFFDNNDNHNYELLLYGGCPQKVKLFELIDKSFDVLNYNQKAVLINGSFFNNNFLVYIIDSIDFQYTHKLYYDKQNSKAILEDYTDNGSEPTSYEEADNYFYTQQIGSILIITKKAQIEVQSVVLCSLDGKIISHLQNVEGWSQFTFDMSFEPSGMYLLRFISRDRAMTKRVVYLR